MAQTLIKEENKFLWKKKSRCKDIKVEIVVFDILLHKKK
jgi:hypothetical protein